jgi:hypothetical protein
MIAAIYARKCTDQNLPDAENTLASDSIWNPRKCRQEALKNQSVKPQTISLDPREIRRNSLPPSQSASTVTLL